jgi:hypothetical protein
MGQTTETALTDLYEVDETAWLEQMAELIREGRFGDLDYGHLSEYLEDMAKRERREVKRRLVALLTHVLEWVYHVKKRSPRSRLRIIGQSQELADLIESGILRNYAEEVLPRLYAEALELVANETALRVKEFPTECPFTLDELLAPEILETRSMIKE